MINFLSSWVKNLSLALIVISILEMILPNNKTKKYIRMVMGLYVLFSIISPFVKNKNLVNFKNIDVDSYISKTEEKSNDKQGINQQSMDKKLNEIYVQELENDVTNKIKEKGYIVNQCNVDAYISENGEKNQIKKIILNISKNESKENEQEDNNALENKVVTEIQKIQKIRINTKTEQNDTNKEKENISTNDIQIIQKFLIEEYGVDEKCLKIN